MNPLNTMKAKFLNTCVGWDPADVHTGDGLCAMIDQARDITRETFCRNVHPGDRRDLEVSLGYGRDFPIARDWHVKYCKSKLHGATCYFLKWSGIEHVFTFPR